MRTVVIVKDFAAAFVIAIKSMAYVIEPFLVELPVTLDQIVHRFGERYNAGNFFIRIADKLAQLTRRLLRKRFVAFDKGKHHVEYIAFQVLAIRLDGILSHTFTHKVFAKTVDIVFRINVLDICHLQAVVRIEHEARNFWIINRVERTRHNSLAANAVFVGIAIKRVCILRIVPARHDFVQSWRNTHQLRITRAH